MSTLAEIEALLFVAGEDGIRVCQLAELLSLPPTGIQQSLEKISPEVWKDQESSLSLIETGGAYRLVTKPQFAAILKEYSGTHQPKFVSGCSWDLVHHCLQATHHADRNWCYSWVSRVEPWQSFAGLWLDTRRWKKEVLRSIPISMWLRIIS